MYSTSTRAGGSSLATGHFKSKFPLPEISLEGVRVSLPGWGSGTRKSRLDPYGHGHADRDAGAALEDLTRTPGAFPSPESGRKTPTGAVWMLLGASEPPITCRTPLQVVLEGNLEGSQRPSDKRVPNHGPSNSVLSRLRLRPCLANESTILWSPRGALPRASALRVLRLASVQSKGASTVEEKPPPLPSMRCRDMKIGWDSLGMRRTKRQCALSPSQKGPTQLHNLGAGVDLKPTSHWIAQSGHAWTTLA
ncbi:hypothetical protein EDB86DRAFT_2825235 [Lactarius hatsudake]|nr:hypothetical protein EDB86DRAFT_2825235 [Lactarius hatsudake]